MSERIRDSMSGENVAGVGRSKSSVETVLRRRIVNLWS